MHLGNNTLMCPQCELFPLDIDVRLGFNYSGPLVVVNLSCDNCAWKTEKKISLLTMMKRNILTPVKTEPKE